MDDEEEMSTIEKELIEYDYRRSWNAIFQRLKNETSASTHDLTHTVALLPENRMRNRYRDIIPYDHSRVLIANPLADFIEKNKLPESETDEYINISDNDALTNDYINASHVRMNQLGNERHYILTQGPTPNTQDHFWSMVWLYRCKVILMLNRIIEKGALKCSPYFPVGCADGDVDSCDFPQIGLRITLLETDDKGFYVKRKYKLEHSVTGEVHSFEHFHYLCWPDFGVPQSPSPFLNFLLAVRRSNAFVNGGPVIVHCSAGVGRSGTFVLVEASLLIAEKANSLEAIDVRAFLTELRSHRMGLIQTWEQLRFSYQAIIQCGRALLSATPEQRNFIEFEMSEEECQPPKDSSDESSSEEESDDSGSCDYQGDSPVSEISLEQNEPDEIPEDPSLVHRRQHKFGRHGKDPYEVWNIGGEKPILDAQSWSEEQKVWQRMCSYKPNVPTEEDNKTTKDSIEGSTNNNSDDAHCGPDAELQSILSERSRLREARRIRTQEQIARMQLQMREQNLHRFRMPLFLRQNPFVRYHRDTIITVAVAVLGVAVAPMLFFSWSYFNGSS